MAVKAFANKKKLQSFILIGILLMLGIYVYGRHLFIPMSRESAQVKQQLITAKEKLRGLEAATANEAAIQNQYRQVEQAVEELKRFMPSEAEIPAVLEILSSLAAKNDVKIQNIFPQRSVAAIDSKGASASNKEKEPEVYKEVPIQIDAVAGFHQLGMFINAVEVGDKPMEVLTLRIGGNTKEPRRHQINLVIRAYFAINDKQTS